jgi:spore photoproduct lyase
MPDELSEILEPGSVPVQERMHFINSFISAGYDVHINFSPVVITPDFEGLYTKLFRDLDDAVDVRFQSRVKAEVIFLTHNREKHQYNERNGLPGENMLWTPLMQEHKISQYGGENIRYQVDYKNAMVNKFRKLHNQIIPWNTIRYIF